MSDGRRCEAFTFEGNRCQRVSTHYHETPGDAVHLCSTHYKMITRRMRQGSDEEYVRAWRGKLSSHP